MTLDRDDADERLARLEKLMREAGAKPAPGAPAPADEKTSRKAAQAKAAGPPSDGARRRPSKRR